MLILIPLALKSPVSHFETVERYRSPDDYGLHVCKLRIRVGRVYKFLVLFRLFTEDREYARVLLSEATNDQTDNETVDSFNQARVPGLVNELVRDWTCEYVNKSHRLFEWRSLMGEEFELSDELLQHLKAERDEPLANEESVFPVDIYFEGKLISELYKAENPLLTDDKNSSSIEDNSGSDVMPSSFDRYFRSDDWKHSNE